MSSPPSSAYCSGNQSASSPRSLPGGLRTAARRLRARCRWARAASPTSALPARLTAPHRQPGSRALLDVRQSSLNQVIHLTGGVQVSSSPRALGWRPLQARRMPVPCWRVRRDLPRLPAGGDVAVARRIVTGGELEQPVEDQPAAPRAAPVESEHELVQVALQVCFLDRALVGAQQPRLASEATRCTAGSSSPGSSPRARAARWLRRWWA